MAGQWSGGAFIKWWRNQLLGAFCVCPSEMIMFTLCFSESGVTPTGQLTFLHSGAGSNLLSESLEKTK